MQEIRGGANVAVQLLHSVQNHLRVGDNFRGVAADFLEKVGDIDAQDGQSLSGTVVEFAGDMTALVILGLQQAPRIAVEAARIA